MRKVDNRTPCLKNFQHANQQNGTIITISDH